MTNTPTVQVGTKFFSYVADGSVDFVVTAVGEVGGTPVVVAEAHDVDFGHMVKAFTVEQVERTARYS